MGTVERLQALEILDSRGRPTLQVRCQLAGGVAGTVQVPSGASTGASEAAELRDGDPGRHGGRGCLRAATHVTGPIAGALCGRRFATQAELDQTLLELDGTSDKSRLGANAVLGVSLAFARASARLHQVPLYEEFSRQLGRVPDSLPQLTVNLFSGGKHAGGQVPIQDVLIVPQSSRTIQDGLVVACGVMRAAAELVQEQYAMRELTADEGGLAPPFRSVEAMFDDAVEAIHRAGYRPGEDVVLAVDVASTQFHDGGSYQMADRRLDSAGMVDLIADWVERYPIVSVEDGLAEDDWPNWPRLRQRLGGRVLTLGDDLLCTNPERIRRAIDVGACDALLLKVNQIGTLTEAAAALDLARRAGWHVTISARSGETEDNWLADLAVGWGGDQIKVGATRQSERLAKYNRLLEIEAEAGLAVKSPGPGRSR